MKSKVAGIASAAAVVIAILGVALGSTFALAGKQDVVDTAVAAGQFKTLATPLVWSRRLRAPAPLPSSRLPTKLSPSYRRGQSMIC